MRLFVAALIVVGVLVLFNLPQLQNLNTRGAAAAAGSQGSTAQPPRQVPPASGSGGNFAP